MRQGTFEDEQDGKELLEQGIALFNARDFFHAHEVWEDWWRATTGPEKQTIQGMIQTAVAMHHYSTGNCDGARSVMERALRNLEGAVDEFRGVNLARLREDSLRVIQQLTAKAAVTFFEIVRK